MVWFACICTFGYGYLHREVDDANLPDTDMWVKTALIRAYMLTREKDPDVLNAEILQHKLKQYFDMYEGDFLFLLFGSSCCVCVCLSLCLAFHCFLLFRFVSVCCLTLLPFSLCILRLCLAQSFAHHLEVFFMNIYW